MSLIDEAIGTRSNAVFSKYPQEQVMVLEREGFVYWESYGTWHLTRYKSNYKIDISMMGGFFTLVISQRKMNIYYETIVKEDILLDSPNSFARCYMLVLNRIESFFWTFKNT